MEFSIMVRTPPQIMEKKKKKFQRMIFNMWFPKHSKMLKLLNSQNVIGFFENLLLSLC